MFGNLLSGELINEYVKSNIIKISNYDDSLLSTAHYKLFPEQISFLDKTNRIHDFSVHGDVIELPPNQYGKIKIDSTISLPKGMVGVFVPASNIIEKGFLLTTGQLDPGYTKNIVFGIYNPTQIHSILSSKIHIAHIRFYDLRAVSQFADFGEYLKALVEIREKRGFSQDEMNEIDRRLYKKGYRFDEYMGGA